MDNRDYGRFGRKGNSSIPSDLDSLEITGDTDGTEPRVVNILYGTGAPPSAIGLPDGTIYIQYVP